MKSHRGQALVELALCAPVVLLLAFGVAAVVQVEDANSGLDSATHAAASVAARAPDPITAVAAARARFAAVAAGYPLEHASITISFGSFARDGAVSVVSQAVVDVSWAGVVWPHRVALRSMAVRRLEPWRTHRPSP